MLFWQLRLQQDHNPDLLFCNQPSLHPIRRESSTLPAVRGRIFLDQQYEMLLLHFHLFKNVQPTDIQMYKVIDPF